MWYGPLYGTPVPSTTNWLGLVERFSTELAANLSSSDKVRFSLVNWPASVTTFFNPGSKFSASSKAFWFLLFIPSAEKPAIVVSYTSPLTNQSIDKNFLYGLFSCCCLRYDSLSNSETLFEGISFTKYLFILPFW